MKTKMQLKEYKRKGGYKNTYKVLREYFDNGFKCDIMDTCERGRVVLRGIPFGYLDDLKRLDDLSH